MSEFKKYMHVERFGTEETENIDIGECYLFPKLDGSNGVVWINDGEIHCGSRKRHLVEDLDNQGFKEYILQQENIKTFLKENQDLRLFGEWLIPHTLKTYRDDAWEKFYVFDVGRNIKNIEGGVEYLHYDEYKLLLDKYEILYIPYLKIIKNPSMEQLLNTTNNDNIYLIEDGKGVGEGIVIKNYKFRNKYGRQIWAKLVRSEFKDKHREIMGGMIAKGPDIVEEKAVEKYLTKAMIDKTYDKIVVALCGWKSQYIPRLLGTTFHDFVVEETWNICKEFKNPKIDFKRLRFFVERKIKEVRQDLF